MAVGRLFGVHHFYQLIQADKCASAVFHGNGGSVKGVVITPRYQHDAHPRRRVVFVLRFRHSQKVGGIIHRNSFADVVYRYAQGL